MNLIAENMEIAAKIVLAQRALRAGGTLAEAAVVAGLPVSVLADYLRNLQRAEDRFAKEQRRAARHLLDEQTTPAPPHTLPFYPPPESAPAEAGATTPPLIPESTPKNTP